jgi:hypothetical protein
MPPSGQAAAAGPSEAELEAARNANITLWTLYAIGVLVTVLRTYARLKLAGWKRFQADDYLVWVAVVSGPRLSVARDAVVLF